MFKGMAATMAKDNNEIEEVGMNTKPIKSYQPGRLDRLTKITNFSKHEIRMLYQGFKQQCPGGEVDEDQFKQVFSQFFPQGDSSKYAHYVFQTIKRSSGKKQCLTFEDLIVMLSKITRGSMNDKLSFIFKLYDQNYDNYISKSEMLAITPAIYDMLGHSTIPSVKNTSAQEHVDLIFDQIDEDHDGLITLTDLTNWCQEENAKQIDLLLYYDSPEQWPKVYNSNKFSEAALLVFSLNSLDSFHCLTQHLLEILSLAENARIYLVCNKCDILPHEVTDEDIDLFLEQFPKFDGVFKTCPERYNVFSQNSSQIIKLRSDTINCTKTIVDDVPYWQCFCIAEFKTSRERWWFLAVANCESKKGLNLFYNFTLLNTRTEWLRHFSADEYAVFPVNIISLFIYCIVLIAIIVQSVQLVERKYFHVTYKIFIGSVVFEFLGHIFLFHYNFNYSIYGYANETNRIFGKGFTVISNLLFLLLLILIAKGYSVTRARLKTRTSIKIAIFMTMYAFCYFFLYFYEQCCFDTAEVLYVYEGWIGYCLITLRFIGLIWFSTSLFKTVKLYPAKKSFFYIIYVMYFVWFVSTPILILLATFVIPKYQREQIVYAFENIVIIRAHVFFLFLTWPSSKNKIFPFHVRTSQIGAMEKLSFNKDKPDATVNTIENSGETLDKFTNYKYAPTVTDDADLLFKLNNNNILFSKNGNHNSNHIKLNSLGDSNYSDERARKSSLPDVS